MAGRKGGCGRMHAAAVIGAGSFGTALTHILGLNCGEVRLWARDAQLVEDLRSRRENVAYLPGLRLLDNVRVTADLGEALAGAELVVSAAPSHATRELMQRAADLLPRQVPIVTVAKGIENDSLLTMTEV